ncbi:MAG: hypothetical protein ACRC8S_11690 [Fimbriiglobus sp.]
MSDLETYLADCGFVFDFDGDFSKHTILLYPGCSIPSCDDVYVACPWYAEMLWPMVSQNTIIGLCCPNYEQFSTIKLLSQNTNIGRVTHRYEEDPVYTYLKPGHSTEHDFIGPDLLWGAFFLHARANHEILGICFLWMKSWIEEYCEWHGYTMLGKEN